MNKLKVAIVGCYYTLDRRPDIAPRMLMRVTKKMEFLRDLGKTQKVALARLCRDYSAVPHLPDFQDYDFTKRFDIMEGYGAIQLATHVYGYTVAQSLTKFLEASKRACSSITDALPASVVPQTEGQES
jgi:hypothetical protein